MEPAGGSALYDALNQGAAQLRRYAGPHTVNHLILLIDGPPTKGPRELDDFAKLAEVFAREGITVSTIGLGHDFNEDVLATLARVGNGHFRYVDTPGKMVDALQAELAPSRTLVARDAVLTIDFDPDCTELQSYGWLPATIKEQTISYRFPYVFAGQDLRLLVSAMVRGRMFAFKIATIRLAWKAPADDQLMETETSLKLQFDTSEDTVRKSIDPAVRRTTVSTLISEGMQEAIEQIDKGDFRKALRALRRADSEAIGLNAEFEDDAVAAKIRQLETYLAEVQARGLNRLDRKILRSGLFNQFDTPTADDPPDH